MGRKAVEDGKCGGKEPCKCRRLELDWGLSVYVLPRRGMCSQEDRVSHFNTDLRITFAVEARDRWSYLLLRLDCHNRSYLRHVRASNCDLTKACCHGRMEALAVPARPAFSWIKGDWPREWRSNDDKRRSLGLILSCFRSCTPVN